MSQLSILEILYHPNENGITIFVLGVLFVLSVYHFLLYFQHKDRVYLFYSLYTFLIFFDYLYAPSSGFISTLVEPYKPVLRNLYTPVMWLYNAVYFIFGFTFLNLKTYSKKWYLIIVRTVIVFISFIFIVSMVSLMLNTMEYIYMFDSFVVPFLFLFGLVSYYVLFKFKMPLKNYIIVGSLVLFLSSLVGYYLVNLNFTTRDQKEMGISIFFIGVIIENIIFSLGLGHKQKMILQDKNVSQQKLIIQHEENEKLRNQVQQQLKKEVLLLSQQAEIDKHEKIKARYDKELAELKIMSLRSQMNPHFIFNSLNAIKLYIIDNKQENAVYYLNKFSKLIRKILAATREKEITLKEEIETIKLYIDIENIRFNNEIALVFTVDKNLGLDTIKIPSLILQPFVENAIWHGLSLKKENKKLHIDIRKEEETHIKIKIEDNGVGREKSALIKEKKLYKKDSIGINLTRERLSNFEKDYNNSYTLVFNDLYDENKNASGTQVVLKIPVI